MVASDSSPVYYRAAVTPDGEATFVSNVILVNRPVGSPAHVRLESSSDLSSWSTELAGAYDVTGTKKFYRIKEDDTSDEFVSVQGGTVNVAGVDVTTSDFQIGRFEITQELWDEVYVWALSNGYSFTNNAGVNWNAGGCVKPAHPINNLNWYDAVKWCNARSEYEGLSPAYFTDASYTLVYQSGSLAPSLIYTDAGADGYRLPTRDEWIYAAHGGQLSLDYTYSGSNVADEVARYINNSLGSECPIIPELPYGAWPAGGLLPNELGLYDMSGNVREWVFDGPTDGLRYIPGGSYLRDASRAVIAFPMPQSAIDTVSGEYGLRLARNVPAQQSAILETPSRSNLLKGRGKSAEQLKVKSGKVK